MILRSCDCPHFVLDIAGRCEHCGACPHSTLDKFGYCKSCSMYAAEYVKQQAKYLGKKATIKKLWDKPNVENAIQ